MHGESLGWMGTLAVVSAVIAAGILVFHLVRRPALTGQARLFLLLGLGVFPILTAGASNVAGFQATQSRVFCGSCHVMEPHAKDSNDPKGTSLSSIHARNAFFGKDNCYTCHKDYGMYGFVLTKMGGMGHVYYYLTEYHDMPLERSRHEIRIRKPIPNTNCTSCHTTTGPRWLAVGDHASSLSLVREGSVSCASPGCHGFAHPVTKLGKELLLDGGLPDAELRSADGGAAP